MGRVGRWMADFRYRINGVGHQRMKSGGTKNTNMKHNNLKEK